MISNHKKLTVVCVVFFATVYPAIAQAATPDPANGLTFDLGMEGHFEDRAYTVERLALSYGQGDFYLSARGLLSNDGKYEAELFTGAPGGKFLGNYVFMEEGGIAYDLGDLAFRFGRFRHYDEIDSPYSLFVNANGLAAPLMELRYDDGFFTYQSRWVELNYLSSMRTPAWEFYGGFPDRGANIKTYAIRAGDLRFGFQDAAVYTGRNFDFEYFASPIPQYFIQYVKGTGGRPWTTGLDENNMIGAFVEKRLDSGIAWYGQLFFEDGNLHWLSESLPDLPWKAAWAAGARLPTAFGEFSVDAAGATMYAFEPITSTSTADQVVGSYGYSYYPDTRFDLGGDLVPIAIEDMMVGYQYGENNAVIRLGWQGRPSGFDSGAFLEYRLSGSSSPANPWHEEYDNNLVTSHFLDEPVLETRLQFKGTLARDYGPFAIRAGLGLGFVWNERTLKPVDLARTGETEGSLPSSDLDNYVWIWKPVDGSNRLLFSVCIGVAYRFATGSR